MKYKLSNPIVRQVAIDGKNYLDITVDTFDCNGHPITFKANRVSLQEADLIFEEREEARPWRINSTLNTSIPEGREAIIRLKIEDDDDGTVYSLAKRPVTMTLQELIDFAEERLNTIVHVAGSK